MISLAEFIALANTLQTIGWAADNNIQKRVQSDTSKKEAIEYANNVAEEWDDEYDILITQGTREVIQNTADHYNNTYHLGLEVNTIVSDVQAIMMTQRFYGATLDRRRRMNMLRLKRVIRQTAQIDPQKLGGLFSDPVPFGAHTNIARRLLLGTLVQAEHQTAKAVAKEADIPFVRWSLSHKHQQEDTCDVLAGYVDKKVVAYLQDNNLDIEPEGLYFREEVPDPPHPNCQCELVLVTIDGDEIHGSVNRAFHAIRQLLQRIKSR